MKRKEESKSYTHTHTKRLSSKRLKVLSKQETHEHDVYLFTFKTNMMFNYRKCSAFIAYIEWTLYQIATNIVLFFAVAFFLSFIRF